MRKIKNTLITLKVTDTMYNEVQERAEELDMFVSEYIRTLIEMDLKGECKK